MPFCLVAAYREFCSFVAFHAVRLEAYVGAEEK